MADITQVFSAAVEKHQAGDLAGAEQLYRSILTKVPTHPATLCNLGAVLVRQDQVEAAAQCYAMCLAESPGYPDAHYNYGNLYRRIGQYRDAVNQYQLCLRANPRHGSAQFNMGLAYSSLGELAAAVNCYTQTLAVEPNHADAYNRLGDAYLRLGKVNEGIEQFRIYTSLKPTDPRGLNNLGLAIANAGRSAEAVDILKRAIAMRPDYPDAHNTIALAYEALGRKDDATEHYQEAVRLNPEFADAWSNYGTNLTEQGRIDEAIAAFRFSLKARPNTSQIHSNLLLTLNYSSHLAPEDIAEEHKQWADLYAPGETPPPAVPTDSSPDRRLRLGYLSGDFRDHTVSGFIEMVLSNHDRTKFQLTGYANVGRPDATTLKLQKLCDQWRLVHGMNDEAIAAQIREDQIDILIDLSGHTAGNRLLACATRPAPVQMTLFGYPNTTGMRAFDYRITDDIADPPGQTEHYYVEQLLRLSGLAWGYRPPTDAPEVGPLPSTTQNVFTFGCLNNAAKISQECLETWVKLLLAIPQSRLVLLAGQSQTGADRLRKKFADANIDSERVELLFRLPRQEYFATYSRFDLALDPFPYNGGITTCDALWMGVPVLGVAGKSYVSRQGVSVMTHVGYPEFIADSPAQMIEVAKMWSSNREWLADIRSGLRQQLIKTGVADGAKYARRLESGLRQAWFRRVTGG